MADLTVTDLQQLLSYDPDTGIITWRVNCQGGPRAGDVSGCVARNRYRYIGVGNELYLSHRLAWALHYGAWPLGEIDHRNGDRLDNRMSNLRVVTHQENNENRGIQSNSTSGYPGVSWYKANRRWSAYIKTDGRKIHLGYFDTAEEANAVRTAAKRRMHDAWATGLGRAS